MSNMESLPQLEAPVEAGQQERYLHLVEPVASVAVADYFNELSGDEQIPCGD